MVATLSGMRQYGHRKTISYRPLPPAMMSALPSASPDWTVLFCGAGGDSIGVRAAGGDIRIASNHWQLALDTHETNFRSATHVCADISGIDPRSFPRTRFLWASPECKYQTLASGRKRLAPSASLWPEWDPVESETAQRSRATMRDVIRFCEVHSYQAVIVENVVEVLSWPHFSQWWTEMTERLGYVGQKVFLNSQHVGIAQSRDRLYMVFTKKGMPVPNLELHPKAWCMTCQQDVLSVQSWRPGRTAGKYRKQYDYLCPNCAKRVEPYYLAALNVIDFSEKITRIGDRTRPLKPKTMERIGRGLKKYGGHPLVLVVNGRSRDGSLRTLDRDPLPTQTSGSTPALVDLPISALGDAFQRGFIYTDGAFDNVYRGTDETLPTITGSRTFNYVQIPWVTETGHGGHENDGRVKAITDPLPTLHSLGGAGLCLAPAHVPFLVRQAFAGGSGHDAYPATQPLHTLTGRQDTGLVLVPKIVDFHNHADLAEATDPLSTISAGGNHHGLLEVPHPFIVDYHGNGMTVHPITDPLSTITGVLRHGLAFPGEITLPDIADCLYRTLKFREIAAGMGFPDDYEFLGPVRARTNMAGNAVTPNAAEYLASRVMEAFAA